MDMTHKPVRAVNVIKTGPGWMYRGLMKNRRRDIETEAGLRPYMLGRTYQYTVPLNMNSKTPRFSPAALLSSLKSINSWWRFKSLIIRCGETFQQAAVPNTTTVRTSNHALTVQLCKAHKVCQFYHWNSSFLNTGEQWINKWKRKDKRKANKISCAQLILPRIYHQTLKRKDARSVQIF
jgi:hypothetical protein